MNVDSITVVLPTANRPFMLNDALASIADQSARELIRHVIVSENSLSTESKHVIDRYTDILPVIWVQQNPPVPPNIHALRLSEIVTTSHVALLSDDDIWDRYHLEEACRAFNILSNICAFFGQAVVVENANCQVLQRFNGTFDQLANLPADSVLGVKCWDQQLTALNQISSTLNMWACVATTDAYKDAMQNSCGHPIYGFYPTVDILFIWRLSYHGNIAVGRHVSLFYRRHAASHMQTVIKNDAILSHEQTLAIRQEIYRQALLLGFDPLSLWRDAHQRMKTEHFAGGLPPMYHRHYRWLVSEGTTDTFLAKLLILIRRNLVSASRMLLPPFVFILLRNFTPSK
jgi:hypothetical protein